MILKIHITFFFAFLYNIYIGKKELFLIAYLFILMHELSHMIMALFLNVNIEEITVLPFGVTAKYVGKISMLNEFLIALAGPVATLLFAFVYHNQLYLTINFLILLFNLLPIYPLDGGRIMRIILITVLGKRIGKCIDTYSNFAFIIVFISFSIYMLVKYQNFSFLLLSLYVLKIYQDEKQKDKIRSIINYLQIDK